MKSYWSALSPFRPRIVALLLLIPACWLAYLFWRVPVADPLTISALLLDRTLQVCTFLLLPPVGAGVLLAPWPAAQAAAATGGIVSVLLGGSVALAGTRPPADPLPTGLAVLCIVTGAALLVWVFHPVILTTRWKVSLLAPLALLPAVQFWHATSFVPARLTTSMSIDPRVTVQHADAEDRFLVVEVQLRNNGDADTLVLAAEVIVCFRPSTNQLLTYDTSTLYGDGGCRTSNIVDRLSQVDAKTSVTYHQSVIAPRDLPRVQLVARVWYARADRMRVDESSKTGPELKVGCLGEVMTYRIRDDARFKGVAQRERILVYDEGSGPERNAFYLTTKGAPPCAKPRYDIAENLGTAYLRVNREDWL
jgi:hypothetical protein